MSKLWVPTPISFGDRSYSRGRTSTGHRVFSFGYAILCEINLIMKLKRIAVLLFLMLFGACQSSTGGIPNILQPDDFAFWSWEPDFKPDTPTWSQVIPPEDLTKQFHLTGYAGDKENVKVNEDWAVDCHSDPTCTKIVYSPNSALLGWAGNLWLDVLYPKYSLGISLENVNRLTFWAKGDNGTEKVEFRVGGTAGAAPQPAFSTGIVTLQKSWQQYSIEFTDKTHLDRVFSGFAWFTTKELNPQGCTFYLDDMQFK